MRLVALARVAAGHALAARGLLAVRFFGVLVAVTLVAGVSLYSAGMGDAMLRTSLLRDGSSTNLTFSNIQQPLSGAPYRALDAYIRRQAGRDLGLPLTGLHVHHYTSTVTVYRAAPANTLGAPASSRSQTVSGTGKMPALPAGRRGTGKMPALPGHTSSTAPVGPALGDLALHYYEDFARHVRVVAGTIDPRAATPGGTDAIAISQYTARSLHLRLGDRLVYASDGGRAYAPVMVVTGIYTPRNVNSFFWDLNAGAPTYRSLVMLRLDRFLAVAASSRVFGPDYFWLYQTNVNAVHLADAQTILDHLQRISSKLSTIARSATLLTSLDLDINGFLDQYNLLPFILFILVAPILALVLYAVAVITALALDRQAGEIVLMRSRGATRSQVFLIYVVEGLVLGLAAVAIGPLLALPLARLIGNASGFLTFTGGLPLQLSLTPGVYAVAAATALLCLLAGLLPALGLARRSMMSFKQEQARLGRRPLWQRLFLDVVVLAVALYGLSVLIRQGPVTSGAATAAIAQDPVIGLAPLLFAVAITLLISRVLPWLAVAAVRLLARSASPSVHVALQSVARAPRQPMRLVQLCTLTLTLGVFAATVAGVEASNLADQQIYQAGSQLRMMEYNVSAKQWDALPISFHLKQPGVRAATPALRFESNSNAANATGDGIQVNVLGVDPKTAPGVMWFRPDFADQPFRQLLNVIAAPGPNAIVSDSFLHATGLHLGDTVDVALLNNTTVHVRVGAVAHYFPTLDPQQYPFVVANLRYLERASHSHASEMWLATDPTQGTVDRLVQLAYGWPRHVTAIEGVTPAFSALDDPLSAGIYGVVSVGFLIALALALLGFFAYAYLSLQQRLAEFAIVRALGLSAGQVRWLLLCEQFFLLGAGILGGIAAGVLTTKLFLPYLPIATDTMPPFLVVMPWLAIGEFVLAVLIVFALMLSAHVSMLLRMQLGRVLRLGEG